MIKLKNMENLAELSRIDVSAEEKKSLLKDIESILSYVDQIKTAVGTTDRAASYEEGEFKNVFREDANCHDSGQFTEALLELAAEKENGYIKIKKIL